MMTQQDPVGGRPQRTSAMR